MGWRSALLLLMVASRGFAANDWLIVPGERVGPVTAGSSEADLRREFGDGAVVRAEIRVAENQSWPGVEILSDRPGESLAVIWRRKDGVLWWPMRVIPCFRATAASGCRWRAAFDVGIGTDVRDLERLNGKPFSLYLPDGGARWTTPLWEGGQLEASLGPDLELDFNAVEGTCEKVYCGGGYYLSSRDPLTSRGQRITRMSVSLLSPNRIQPRNDWTIVPGVRFGPIPLGAPLPPLRETFGPENADLARAGVPESDGKIPAIRVFDTLLSEFANDVCFTQPTADKDKTCRWRIVGGVPMRGSLSQFENLNGKPFEFNGGGWDYGGVVASWCGGKLDRVLGRAAYVYVNCSGSGDLPQGEGVTIRSNDRRLRGQGCEVVVDTFFAR